MWDEARPRRVPTLQAMRRATSVTLCVLGLLAACASEEPDNNPAGTAISSELLADAARRTVLDQAITYPDSGSAEITTAIIEIPPGAETGWHLHEVPLVAYIVSGELTVTYDTDSGNVTKSYQAGESVLEAIGTRHNGRNDGDEPVRLFAVYLGAEGSENTIRF